MNATAFELWSRGTLAMTIEEIAIDKNKVAVRGRWIELQHAIEDAFLEDNRIFVLFDPAARSWRSANLICVGTDGRELWVAEFPEAGREDYYYLISSRKPLVVNSFSSYKCTIDGETGRILGREFVK